MQSNRYQNNVIKYYVTKLQLYVNVKCISGNMTFSADIKNEDISRGDKRKSIFDTTRVTNWGAGPSFV